MILAIDPGLRWCGVCIGNGEVAGSNVVRAGLVLNPDKTGRGLATWKSMAEAVVKWAFETPAGARIHQIYVEIPRIYPRMDQRKGDLNDLLELAGVAGSIGMAWTVPVSHYYPADWKGQVPKKIMTERIRKKLTAPELDNMITSGAKDHNTLDAIGIFLHSCGRL